MVICIKKFQENNTEALVISKELKFPLDDRTDTNFKVLLRMHFLRPRRTLDSLKSVFNVFRRKLSLGGPNGFGGLSLEQDIVEVLVSEQLQSKLH